MTKKDTEVKTNEAVKEVDYKAKWKEARENLVIQLKEHLDKTEHHKTMATKAQGAIEVGDQIYSEEQTIDS